MDKKRQNREMKFWNRFAGNYDRFMKNLQAAYELVFRKMDAYLDPSKTVLDIATGTGIVALGIAPKVKKVVGCDISHEMIRTATAKARDPEHGNVEFLVQDAYHLEFAEESFDIVIASNVLHVMIFPNRALLAVRNVLKKDGILIAPTYCHGESYRSRMVSFLMSLAGFRAFQKWSVAGFREFLESGGFQVMEFEVIEDKIPLVFAVARKSG